MLRPQGHVILLLARLPYLQGRSCFKLLKLQRERPHSNPGHTHRSCRCFYRCFGMTEHADPSKSAAETSRRRPPNLKSIGARPTDHLGSCNSKKSETSQRTRYSMIIQRLFSPLSPNPVLHKIRRINDQQSARHGFRLCGYHTAVTVAVSVLLADE